MFKLLNKKYLQVYAQNIRLSRPLFLSLHKDKQGNHYMTWPRGYKACFLLNSTEHEISNAHTTKMLKIKDVSCFQTLRCCIYEHD